MNFKNKTVFISGVNRGLGKYIFESFLKEGASIICTVRKRDIKFSNYLKIIKKNIIIKLKSYILILKIIIKLLVI